MSMPKERNEELTRTGPDTLMGDLVRRYWIPALLALLVCGGIHTTQAQTAQEQKNTFWASYVYLSDEQRAVIDDFFRRAGAIARGSWRDRIGWTLAGRVW